MGAQRLLDGGSTMKRFRERKSWIVLIAVLLLFAACKGESPTAPPPGGGIPPGGTPPPTGVSVTVTTSNANPLVDSSVVITATVTLNGQSVPNGTAVEFVTTSGVLDGGGQSTIKTTTNGIATVTLTSGSPGLVRVTVTVNNVVRTQDVTFVSRPVEPPPPNTTPTITSVSPTIGRPQGGEVIRLTGTNFAAPVRVLFNTGGPLPVEASVQSVSPTLIEVITPPVNLGAGQQLIADIIVLTKAGSASEQRVEAGDAFTFRNEQLIPRISTITPNSGPVTGGTRVTIFGDGFQEPVQVLFNTAEAKVLNVQFDRINVETPAARDTDPNGQGPVTGPVTVLVRNINSQTETSMGAGFHYKAAMQITGVTLSGNGTTSGGGRVTIEGIGFVSPVIAVIADTAQGDIGLNLISVTGTKIVALIPLIIPESCDVDIEGEIEVTNIDNGDQATGPQITLGTLEPSIVGISPTTVVIGTDTSFTVRVLNPMPGPARFEVGGKTLFPTGVVDNGDGTATFTVPVPTNLDFPTEDCGVAGTRQLPLDADVTYVPAIDGCDDSVPEALTVVPDPTCVEPPPPPPAEITPVSPVGGACADAGNAAVLDPATSSTTIQFRNDGGQLLTIVRGANTGTHAGDFTVTPSSLGIDPGAVGAFTVTFNPSALGARTATANFTTNDPDDGEAAVAVCLQGNGT
jgi:hypothetical protein